MGSGHITEETLDQYVRYVTRWKQAGRPEPMAWLATLTLESAHGARSALLWYHRETGGNVLDLPAPPHIERILRALTVEPGGGSQRASAIAEVSVGSRQWSYRDVLERLGCQPRTERSCGRWTATCPPRRPVPRKEVRALLAGLLRLEQRQDP